VKSHLIRHAFVEFLPESLQEGTLYVSILYATAAHKCFCGCGNDVITPLSPTAWKLGFDGRTVSLHPSIGNWSFPCKSHYWVKGNKIEWARKWSNEEIEASRSLDGQQSGAERKGPSKSVWNWLKKKF